MYVKTYVLYGGLGYRVELHELTPAEFARLPQTEERYSRKVPAQEAHKWVREGGFHTTPLWLDGGRVRYARDCA
jgi:hypothetical protein